MLVRIGPQVQAVLRVGPHVTDPEVFDTGDQVVDAALTDMAGTDPVTANQAEAAFGALTWGQGLQVVSLRSVQEFLWYQLPTKFAVPVTEQREVAHALGVLFDRVGLPRYAELCTSPVTDNDPGRLRHGRPGRRDHRVPEGPCTPVVSNHPRSPAC